MALHTVGSKKKVVCPCFVSLNVVQFNISKFYCTYYMLGRGVLLSSHYVLFPSPPSCLSLNMGSINCGGGERKCNRDFGEQADQDARDEEAPRRPQRRGDRREGQGGAQRGPGQGEERHQGHTGMDKEAAAPQQECQNRYQIEDLSF